MIQGVIIKELVMRGDSRGWLSELFRTDEIPEGIRPELCYVSLTLAGAARGPHEHLYQTDMFFFVGTSIFKIYLWDNRINSKTYNTKFMINAGTDELKTVIVPPGVVHAYKNIGNVSGLVINCPNRLYRGYGRLEDADEVRYEDIPESGFIID